MLLVGAMAQSGSKNPSLQKRPANQDDAMKTTRSPHGNLNIACQNCHTFSGWKPIRNVPEFDHGKTNFPLQGGHKTVPCAQCHTNLVFSKVGHKCADCHADIHRRQMGANCESCHNVQSWTASLKSVRDHQNRFPLIGAHALLECSSCHKNAAAGQFQGLSTDCASCHINKFISTTTPNHKALNFSTNCQSCHTTMDTWLGAKFDHSLTGFALTGAHATLACQSCHTNGTFQKGSANCINCHQKDFDGTKNPNHAQAGFSTTCQTCHNTTTWAGAVFDHSKTLFPLTGAHIAQQCQSCHSTGVYKGLSTTCASCHMTDFNKTTNPNHAQAGFPTTCQTCHSTTKWTDATFDHNKSTKFALTGAHANVQCTQCHINGKFAGTPTDCASCHTPDYNKTTNPNHVQAGFSTKCDTCHTTSTWTGAVFDHSKTQFPLTGAHVSQTCQSCHSSGKYAGLSTLCASCHQADFNKTTDPNHVTAGFPTTCETCHTTTNWTGAKFDHSTTGFALTGAHQSLQCAQCHVNGQYKGTSANCVNCHQKDYNGATDPNHVQAGFPTTCQQCHTTTTWAGAKFDHATTGFTLTGAHVNVQCAQCHVNGKFAGTPKDCASCHLTDFNKTTNPNHVQAGFPTTCDTCHSTANWTSATFDHNKTLFPLTGAHINQACLSCHSTGVYKGLSTTCASCHMTDFNKTTNPNHVQAGFPTTCETCHSTTNWTSSTFNHNTSTSFPLTGSHVNLQCSQCHVNGKFAGTPKDCASCHTADFNKTTNPNHAKAGFPTDCSICHTTTAWTGAVFDHSKTLFPLTGAHINQTCTACHSTGVYKGLSTLCYSCHTKEYTSTTNPNHAQAGFPTTCEVCHSTSNWTSATFDHSKTVFPLTGAHVNVQCAQCHVGGRYAGTPTDCYSCHKTDYTSVTNPNHVAAAFPTTCTTCHNTTSWAGATFNHTWFPIYSGTHAGRWTTCADCHQNASDFAVFQCTACHTHDKTTTDGHHRGVRNYVYNSANCYACHPTGRAG